ncbi:MAG TPA: hypothetical protein VKD91_05285 [Pyrinomonadaceae bacterium]|nr:hypothetical protein [Pyrinomonadaceae bacterium]
MVAIIAAAILIPLLMIGALVLILLPVVRRRRQAWRSAAARLGLQCDSTSMWGVRELPVRIFWQVEGQRVGQLDVAGAVLAGRHDMRGGRAGLRYVYCRAMLEPPLGLGLSLTRNRGDAVTTIPTARAAFDSAFVLSARDASLAQKLFLSTAGDMFAQVAQCGWQLSATDEYVQIRLGGDYFSQFPERQPELLSSALETVVMCGRHLLAARRGA